MGSAGAPIPPNLDPRRPALYRVRAGFLSHSIHSQYRLMPLHTAARLEKKIQSLDEVRFIRSWLEKPLSTGAVAPSSKLLARTMAAYVDPQAAGPVIELGPGTGPVTEALVTQGVDPARLVLVEFNPTFCRLLRSRYPTATVVQGDAYSLQRLLGSLLREPAAAVVSGLAALHQAAEDAPAADARTPSR